jgi:N utilization substance protein A
LADKLVGEGYLSYDDLSVIEPDVLMELGGLTEEEVERISEQAEQKAEEAERAAADERRRQRDLEKHAPPPADDAQPQQPEIAADPNTSVEGVVADESIPEVPPGTTGLEPGGPETTTAETTAPEMAGDEPSPGDGGGTPDVHPQPGNGAPGESPERSPSSQTGGNA